MAVKSKPASFVFEADDPLAAEHADVAAWVEDAVSSLGEYDYYKDVDLKSLPSGIKLFEAKPEQARRYVIAAVAQTAHWDQETEKIRAQAETEMQRINAHHLPGWNQIWCRRRQAGSVVNALMRRALPFQRTDLLSIIQWCLAKDGQFFSTYFFPFGYIVRALERYLAQAEMDPELRAVVEKLAARLRSSHDKDAKRLATTLEQLCPGTTETLVDVPSEIRPAPEPAAAGMHAVLRPLKRLLKMLPDDDTPTTVIGPDQFPLREDTPLRAEHDLLTGLLEEVVGSPHYYQPDLRKFDHGQALLALDPSDAGKAILAAAERHSYSLLSQLDNAYATGNWQARYAVAGIVTNLAKSTFTLSRDGLFDLLLYLSSRPVTEQAAFADARAGMIAQIQEEARTTPLTEGERYVMSLWRVSLISGPPLGKPAEEVRLLTTLIGDGASFCLVPGEVWSDVMNEDFSTMTAAEKGVWASLLSHCLTATAARPSAKWLQTGQKLVAAIGAEKVQQALEKWFPLVSQGMSVQKFGTWYGDVRGSSDVMNLENANCLRGLLWVVQLLPQRNDLARHCTAVALSAYKKVPGVGPRAVKVGNAAVYALSELASTEAVGQLAMLKVRVKFGTAQKEIEKAFTKAAEELGLPRDQIEEMGVPTYGLEEIGRHIETMGDYRAELVVTGSDAELKWFDTKGKMLKSVPAKVKSDHKEDLKELQQSLKDIQAMLPAQRDRIDSMFLLEKSWPIDVWSERYLNHPLVGTIARKLLWCVDGVAASFVDGQPTDVSGRPIAHGKTAEITLWHPVGRSMDEVTGWRRRLEELVVTQPFKQAHREVYLLTDAERNTNTYSNRFAAHIIRQHQFNALCAARGWKNKLRLMVDDSYPPAAKELPNWGLRAEFWVEGIGDHYGGDTNDSGVYLRLATDQVRFYRSGAAQNYAHAGGGGYSASAAGPGQDNINEPISLAEVPALVLSEVMRDVDLFVGVASVGNDPTWQDGGPEGRYQTYWQQFSFGELSGTATTRKQVLERLIPRLKIAPRCSFSERFLVVRGDKRTYKIHLGSGNILMEPNDQYLCIVPDARTRAKQEDLFLPFEGDSTLSIVISKALLLADDTKIKDPTITRQIDA